MKWLAHLEVDGTRSVIPLDDLIVHSHSISCACNPTVDGLIVVHHSADSRETLEPDMDPNYQPKVN